MSAERQLHYVATGLMIRGWDVHVLAMASGGQYWPGLAESERIKTAQPRPPRSLDFSIISKSVRYVRRHQIGIVQGWMQRCNTSAARRGRMTRRNVVLGVGTRSRAVYGIGPRAYLRSEPAWAKWARATVIPYSQWLAFCRSHKKPRANSPLLRWSMRMNRFTPIWRRRARQGISVWLLPARGASSGSRKKVWTRRRRWPCFPAAAGPRTCSVSAMIAGAGSALGAGFG